MLNPCIYYHTLHPTCLHRMPSICRGCAASVDQSSKACQVKGCFAQVAASITGEGMEVERQAHPSGEGNHSVATVFVVQVVVL